MSTVKCVPSHVRGLTDLPFGILPDASRLRTKSALRMKQFTPLSSIYARRISTHLPCMMPKRVIGAEGAGAGTGAVEAPSFCKALPMKASTPSAFGGAVVAALLLSWAATRHDASQGPTPLHNLPHPSLLS